MTPFPPGYYYANGEFHVFNDIAEVSTIVEEPLAEISGHIRRKLERAVKNVFMQMLQWAISCQVV